MIKSFPSWSLLASRLGVNLHNVTMKFVIKFFWPLGVYQECFNYFLWVIVMNFLRGLPLLSNSILLDYMFLFLK